MPNNMVFFFHPCDATGAQHEDNFFFNKFVFQNPKFDFYSSLRKFVKIRLKIELK